MRGQILGEATGEERGGKAGEVGGVRGEVTQSEALGEAVGRGEEGEGEGAESEGGRTLLEEREGPRSRKGFFLVGEERRSERPAILVLLMRGE